MHLFTKKKQQEIYIVQELIFESHNYDKEDYNVADISYFSPRRKKAVL